MNKLRKQFEESCKRSFQFLINQYSCQIVARSENSAGVSVTYANSTTGIEVSIEPRENFIFVYLIQLQNGKVPAYLDAPGNWVYLDSVLSLNNPNLKVHQKKFGDWLKPKDVNEILENYANALRVHGREILTGDFTVFKAIKQQQAR